MVLAADGGEQGFVDAGALVSFVNKISKQSRYDVLNSTLFAQLAADYLYNRKTQSKDWYEKYVEVLSHVGWDLQSFQFEQYRTSGETLQISEIIIDIAKAIVSGEELKTVKRVVETLDDAVNKPSWEIFSKESSGPSSTGNFQLMPCKEDSSGQVVMAMGCFYFKAATTEQ